MIRHYEKGLQEGNQTEYGYDFHSQDTIDSTTATPFIHGMRQGIGIRYGNYGQTAGLMTKRYTYRDDELIEEKEFMQDGKEKVMYLAERVRTQRIKQDDPERTEVHRQRTEWYSNGVRAVYDETVGAATSGYIVPRLRVTW